MVKLSDLAQRSDFRIGQLMVSPARRRLEGPAGAIHVEPLIFQAFLLLLDARGKVVTRDELFDKCWGSTIVGDDSLNRAIAGVRGIAAKTSPGLFEVETIPRTGYRLVGEILSQDARSGGLRGSDNLVTRRTLAVGALSAAGAGAVGLWSFHRFQANRRFHDLMGRAEDALHYGASYDNAVALLQAAVAAKPDNARAQGLFAYAQCMAAEGADPRNAAATLQGAERAATASLAIDPEEPNARVANIVLQRSVLDLQATENALRAVLETDPKNAFAMKHYWALLQSTGQSRAAWAMNQRATALHPLAAAYTYPRAQLLWILGQDAEADRVIDRAMGYWPDHPYVRFARLTIFAFTGRPRAALAMLDDDKKRPQYFKPATTAVWRASLEALDKPSPANVAGASNVIIEAAHRAPELALPGVFMLSALGEVDTAFEIANEFLLFRRPVERKPQAAPQPTLAKSKGWRFTPWLFIPPTKAMRIDPRFGALCEGLGLTEYWERRHTGPDRFLIEA